MWTASSRHPQSRGKHPKSSRTTIQLGQHKLRLSSRKMCHFRAEEYSETADRSACDAGLQNSAPQSRRDSTSIAAARRKDNRNRPCDISPRPAIEGDCRAKRDQKVGSWNLHECTFPRLRENAGLPPVTRL